MSGFRWSLSLLLLNALLAQLKAISDIWIQQQVSIGLIKTILAVNKALIPPSMHFNHPNPQLQIEKSPFYILKPKAWSSRIRTAGVSSFGIGGTNCHIIIAIIAWLISINQTWTRGDNNFEYSLLLSAATKESLKTCWGDYAINKNAPTKHSGSHNALQQRQLNFTMALIIPLTGWERYFTVSFLSKEVLIL